MRKNSSATVKNDGQPGKCRKENSRSQPEIKATKAGAFLTDMNEGGFTNATPEMMGEEEIQIDEEQHETTVSLGVKKKQKVPRPSTFHRIRHENLSNQTLKLPYGLKFKQKVGMPLPKNLEEAASSVSTLESKNPDILNKYALDLDVLLGNKIAPSPTAQKEEKEEPKESGMVGSEGGKGDGDGDGEQQEAPKPTPIIPYDSERDGPPRFGGGHGGKPLSSLEEKEGYRVSTNVSEGTDRNGSNGENTDKVETVHDRLLGLPGSLGISTNETENYFGEQSRVNFFDRYHYMIRQRLNTALDSDDRSAGLVFPSQGEVFGTGVKSTDMPFAPVRPDGQGSGAALLSSSISHASNADVTATGLLADAHARGASRAGRGGLFSKHNALSATLHSGDSEATADFGSTLGRSPGTTLLPPLPLTAGLGAASTTGSPPQKESSSIKINTGVEMSELFGKASSTGSLGHLVESTRTLDQMANEARALREAKIKASMEERRLREVTELTMEEEEAMEMEAIALQGLILEAAEKERRRKEAEVDAGDTSDVENEEKDNMNDANRCKSGTDSVVTELTVGTPLNDMGALLTPLSPRSQYLDGCLRAGINPKASLMTRKAFSKRLDLRHHGIGDEMCLILTESIRQMPYLQSLVVQDNNLTDASLGPLVQALVKMPNILEVDISNNIVGDLASNTLSNYLSSPECPIIKLVMQSADVDDFECARFVLALQNNPCSKLQELDLTRNLLGAAEELNTVMPELVTAGEAFAELLESENCGLTKLEIAWNMVRGESAETFADALSINKSITYLDLSYNTLGKSGGQRLGHALIENKTLEYLDISSNNLEATACFSISVGLIENTTIRRVKLDGNPIGKLGAKALMQVPLMVGRRIRLSAHGCNLAISDASLLQEFDFDNLLKIYELDCSNAFERAQVYMLTYTVASHHTYVFESVAHDGRPIELVPFMNPDRHQFFGEKLLQMERSLHTLIDAASDVKVAVQFFNSIDMDGSGELDRDEFKLLMDKMGIELDEDRLEEVFDTYDTDQGGTIGTDEFLVFLRRQKQDAEKRLFDLTLTPTFCLKADQAFNQRLHKEDIAARKSKLAGYKSQERKKFKVPSQGKMVIKVEDGFKRKQIFRTVTVADKESIEEVAEGTNDTVAMNSFGVMGVKLRLDEALSLYNVMTMESRNKAKVLSKILPQLANPSDARMLVQKVLKNDRSEMFTLRQTLGVAIRPLLGSMNGHYQLDLSVALDRLCLMRLLEQSNTRNMTIRRMKKAPLAGCRPIDLSQRKLSNSCFRNETYNGRPVHIDAAFATPLPRMGILSFDFSGGNLPSPDDMICSDQRVVKILVTLHLLHGTPDAMDAAIKKLERLKRAAERSIGGNGMTIYENSMERGLEIGEAMECFYENLSDRINELEEVKEQEDIPVNVLAKEHMDAIRETTEERLVGQILGHHFDLAEDRNLAPGSLDRKDQRASARRRADRDDASQTSLSVSQVESQNMDTMSIGSIDYDGSIATMSQEESQSVVLKANQINFADEQEPDEEEELNEENERLYLVITSIDTRKIAVGSGKLLPHGDHSRSQPQVNGGEEDVSEKGGDQEAKTESRSQSAPLFPYMQIILGDQRARSCSFARDQALEFREAHLRDLQKQNHLHKHGRGHHGKRQKKETKKALEESDTVCEDHENDDVPVYPLLYSSPNFVCVKSNDAYELETEALKRMVIRRREELEKQREKEKKERENTSKKAKHGNHEEHNKESKKKPDDQNAPAPNRKPIKSIREFGDEDSDEEGNADRAREDKASEEVEEGPELRYQVVSDYPSEEPISLCFDPGPQGTTQMMLLLMDVPLQTPEQPLSQGGPHDADDQSSLGQRDVHMSSGELFLPSQHLSEAPLMAGEPSTLAKAMVDIAQYMGPLMAGQEVEVPWQRLDIKDTAASTRRKNASEVDKNSDAGSHDGGDGGRDEGEEGEGEGEEGVRLGLRMMKGKDLREWSYQLAQRRSRRHELLEYEALSDEEKARRKKDEQQMMEDAGIGSKRAEKMRLVGDDGGEDQDIPSQIGDQNTHKDGRNINTHSAHVNEQWAVKFRATMLHNQVAKRAKALRFVETLDDSFCKQWILCRHLALILECFEHMGKLHRTAYFGSYRTDLVCYLYERLVDVHNFDLVLRVLHPYEVGTVICRLGWLNFFNPLKPEGGIQLNLRRYEERMIAKFLCTLAIVEPGENWKKERFFHDRNKDEMVGFELPERWLKQDGKDDGVRPRGILQLIYYSGDGQRLEGCKPNVNFRKALLNLCFISETDFRPEEDFSEPLSSEDRKKYYEKGTKYAASNQGLFANYLYCDKQKYGHVMPVKRGADEASDDSEGDSGND